MTEGFDTAIFGSGSLLRKGYTSVISNVSKAIAIITLSVSALLSFTDIGFGGVHGESFTSTLVMMLIASYIMYFSLEDAGERLGRDNEDYKAAVRRYNEARNQISGDDIVALRGFCLKYRENELDYRRTNALISKGYTKEEYEAYKRGELKSRRARRELMRVDKIRHSELSAADLLSCRVSKGDVDMHRPGMSKILSLIIRLIPSTVCTFFTVSVIISAKNDLTFSSVAESILKLATLPIIGLKGYSLGYEYAIGNELSWLNMKTELLCAFIKKREA